MAAIHATCSLCGQPIVLDVAEPFARATLVTPLCPACTDQHFLDQGGAVLLLRRELEGARFALGKITITAGAVDALAAASQHAVEFLLRHVRGDWGTIGQCDQIELTAEEQRRGWEATDDSGKINKFNLLNRCDSIMSEYATSRGMRIWVVTHLGDDPVTTVLLPEEY